MIRHGRVWAMMIVLGIAVAAVWVTTISAAEVHETTVLRMTVVDYRPVEVTSDSLRTATTQP